MNDNALNQDEAAILAELPPIPGPVPHTPQADPPLQGGGDPAAPGARSAMASWGQVSTAAVDIFVKGLVAPNWTIENPPRENLIEAIAGVLDDLMPGGLGNIDSWGPYGKLAFACGAVALANFDPERGTIKPLRRPKPKAAAPAEPAPDYDPDIAVPNREPEPDPPAPAKPTKKRAKKRVRRKSDKAT